MKKLVLAVATGFGLGYSPIASGTVASVLGIPLVFLAHVLNLAPMAQAGGALILALAAIPVCTVAEDHFGRKDDGRIVADEYLTFPICMIGLPWNPWVLGMAFVTCRFMDIVKPPPARQIQALRGGWGIVMDDVFASVYSLALNHALYRWVISRYMDM